MSISLLRRLLMKEAVKDTAGSSGIMSINKNIAAKVEQQVQRYVNDAMRQGVDLDTLSPEQLKMIVQMNKPKPPRVIAGDSPEGRGIMEALLGKRGEVVDMAGKKLDTSQGIMGGKSVKELMDSGQVTKGARGMKKSKKVQDREMFEGANQRLKNETEAEIAERLARENKESAARIKNQKMVDDAIDNASPGFAGDRKYDAQLVADDLAEKRFNKEFYDLDQKQQMDLYDEAYQGLSKKKFDPPEDMADGGVAGLLGERTGFRGGGYSYRSRNTSPGHPSNRTTKASTNKTTTLSKSSSTKSPGHPSNKTTNPSTNKATSGGGGPAGGASAGGNYGGNVNPQQTYAGRTLSQRPSNYGGTGPSTPTPTVTTGGQSPFPYTRRVGITSNYMNPTFRKAAIDRARQYQLANRPTSFLENLQDLYGPSVTQIGYVPKSLKPKKPLKKTAWDYATTEGVGAQKFADWRKTEPASLFEEYHSDYGDQLQRELELSDKIKTLGEDYVKGFDIKGIGDSYDDQRQAVNTLLGDIETKKEGLRTNPETTWMEKEDIERTAKSQLQSGYLENKDRLDDLGITNLEEYKEFLNKSIGLADGGPARQNFAMGKRAFLKLMGGVGAGIAGLKSGLFGMGGKKAAVKEVVKQSAGSGTPPAYFFKLVDKIKTLGDDVTEKAATKDRQVVKQYKDFELTEDVATGEQTIQRIKTDTDAMYYDEVLAEDVYMNYKPGKGQADETTKGIPADEYVEDTSYLRTSGPSKGDIYDTVDGVPDDILKEVGETVTKKASGGIARILGE
jgi:hypothetical protein